MIVAILAILCGFVGLVWSADRFVTGAAATAHQLGMSTLMIGLTVVAFGTSAPEMIVSFNAVMNNASDMAVGNALGSNLANIGLVLSITVLIVHIPISQSLMRRELPLLAFVTLLAGYTLYDYSLDFSDGVLLLVSLIFACFISVKGQMKDTKRQRLLNQNLSQNLNYETEETIKEPSEKIAEQPSISTQQSWFLLLTGLALLIVSSQVLVWGAKEVAALFGVSQLVIGLTLVAVGTSLPELAASVASALKGHVDIALGNVVGSNLLNLAAVMAIPALFGGVNLQSEVFSRDYAFMAGITVVMLICVLYGTLFKSGNPSIGKLAALAFLLIYGAYYTLLFSAQ